MIKILKKLFWHPLSVEASVILETNFFVKELFVFQIQGQPKGRKKEFWLVSTKSSETIFWWKDNGITQEKKTYEANLFGDLFKILDESEYWNLKDDLGNVKDGIHYALIFLSEKKHQKTLIWNPSQNSNSEQIITKLRNFFENYK